MQYVLTINKLLPSILLVNDKANAMEMPPLNPPHVNTARFKPFRFSFRLNKKKAGNKET